MGSFSYLEPVAASRPSQPRAIGHRTRQFAAHYAAERNCGHPHSNFRWPRRLSARLPATEQLRSYNLLQCESLAGACVQAIKFVLMRCEVYDKYRHMCLLHSVRGVFSRP